MKKPSATNKFSWFIFRPAEWIEVMTLSDEEAGAIFKEMLIRLSKNEAPEGSIESFMIKNSKEYSQKQRDRIMARWNKKNKCDEKPKEEQKTEPKKPKMPKLPPVETGKTTITTDKKTQQLLEELRKNLGVKDA